MTKRELIEALEALECDDDAPVYIKGTGDERFGVFSTEIEVERNHVIIADLGDYFAANHNPKETL